MKRRDKANVMKVVFGILAILAIGIIWAANYTLAVDAATWLVNTHDFFLDIYTALSTDYNVLIIIGVVVFGGYYFLVYKPRLRK
jgi:hypothetical protein